ncbi:aromatic-ring hydroxylase C-terminal domain-containing protein [Nocardia sp. NPDC004573]
MSTMRAIGSGEDSGEDDAQAVVELRGPIGGRGVGHHARGSGIAVGVDVSSDMVELRGIAVDVLLHAGASDELLDTYESERHPTAARVLHNTRAQTALMRPGAHTDALRDIMGDLIDMDAVRRRLGLMITALDIRYDTECNHELAGGRVPDADLTTVEGATRVSRLLHGGRPVLLLLNGTDLSAVSEWEDRIEIVRARTRDDHWAVPGIGDIPTPGAVLVRPDGYAGWVADGPTTSGLTEAHTTSVGALAW